MKKSELIFSALQVPVDFVMIILAAMSAYAIRDIPQIIALKPKLYLFPFDEYIMIVLMVAPFFLLIYASQGLYRIRSTRKFWREAYYIFTATSMGLVLIIVTIFLKREWFSSRFIILAGWILVVAYVLFARFIMQKIQKWLLIKKGIGIHRLLLIGSNGKIKKFREIIKAKPQLGFRIIDLLDTGSVRAIKEVQKEKGVDEIIMCDPSVTDSEMAKIVDFCAINNIGYQFIPTSLQTSRFEMKVFNGEPMIVIKHTPLEGWGRIIKRLFDLVVSLLLTIITSPIMILTASLIWIESKGPIIYRNERVGNDGKKFFVYKFRYMKWEYCINKNNPQFKKAVEYEKELIKELSIRKGPLYKIKNDPRKTKVGNFIEKYSIDELPQLFNVIRGQMSLVGPRPHQLREVEKYQEYHRRLLTIKPGITGLAQISGRSDLDFEEEYKLDVFYIENWSPWLDIIILIKTAGVILRRRKNNY